jgi:UDP-N-acetylglucosamine 2-epimerase (non-hydrolysing)
MERHANRIRSSTALSDLGLKPGRYFLVTMHRAENVDREDTLKNLMEALRRLRAEFGLPVVCSFHPRTRSKAERFAISVEGDGMHFLPPLGFFDFLRLQQGACCVVSDSGTVQEEACIMGTSNVTIREVTERPETVECGSNFLAGSDPEAIVSAVRLVRETPRAWQPPAEYLAPQVAETVVRIVTSFRAPNAAEREWQTGARI